MTILVAFLAAVGPIALGVTKAVDFVRDLVNSDWRDRPWLWNLVAFAFGVGYCLLFQFNAMALIAGLRQDIFAGTAGQVATGLAIGATADYWHKHLAQKSAKARTVPPRG